MAENRVISAKEYITSLERGNRTSKQAIKMAIHNLGLFRGCNVLDIPCGIGNHSAFMVEEQSSIDVLGADYAEEHLSYARDLIEKKGFSKQVLFENQDINDLVYKDNTFDFVWCCDGLWPGPPEMGCLAEEPYNILDNFVRVTKSGGTIAVVYFSGMKLLPGYPLLEAGLYSTLSANKPVTAKADKDLHFMKTPLWLEKAGLTNIQSRTFISDINGPFNKEEKESFLQLLNAFWKDAETEVSSDLWNQFKEITDPKSKEFILNNKGFAGFITYTMFTGEVVK